MFIFKFSKLEPSGIQDSQLGKEIYVTTTARKFYRENLGSSDPEASQLGAKLSNIELNNILANHASKAKIIKNIKLKDGFGQIRYSQPLSCYFIISYDDSYAKLISIKNQINTGKITGLYPSMISSGITDQMTGKEIRVSTTARKAIIKLYPNKLIPSSSGQNVKISEANPLDLTKFIAANVSSRSNYDRDVKAYFRTRNGEKAQIRTSGTGMGISIVFVLVLKDTLDVISVQDSYRSKSSPKSGEKGRREQLSVLRESLKPKS